MGIKETFQSITEYFDKQKIEYGIIGAFALYSYGYVRATRDIDFLTRSKNKVKIILFLESLGFHTTFSSEAFSNHVHPVGSSRVDIMYVDGSTADELFGAVSKRLVFEGLKVPVVSPEHLVAMKLFAIQNNPERKFKDLADIKEILQKTTYNKESVRKFFKQYGQYEYYNEITGNTSHEK